MVNKLYQYALFVRKLLGQDWDHWSIFSGIEGSGKSTEAIWFCHYVSGKNFRIKDHVVYTPEDFVAAVESARKGDSILLDEGGEAWYNLQFATKMNQALDKTAMMCREYNLNIVMAVPYIFYLGKVAIRRHRVWVNVEAKNFERGYSEWYKPHWPKYGKADTPYWNPMFIQYFIPLPDPIKQTYQAIKHQKGLERLQEYKEVCKQDAPQNKEPEDIVKEIRKKKNKAQWQNKAGSFDRYRIMYSFKVPETIARQVCSELNGAEV